MKRPASNITRRNDKLAISKRSHGPRKKRIVPTGDGPSERVLKNGKVRLFDLLSKDSKADPIPRKTREFMARMTRWNLVPTPDVPETNQSRQKDENKTIKASGKKLGDAKERTQRTGTEHPNRSEKGGLRQSPENPSSKKRFDGMTSGESLYEYSARLRKESKLMAIDIARKGNHQSEKRKAYNKKRRERVARRKRRRRGDCSDSDVEDNRGYREETTQSISHLPAYWQEIVNNNGRPVSTKKKRRVKRMEKEATTNGTFRDQVERPPDLTVRPVRRGGNVAMKSA